MDGQAQDLTRNKAIKRLEFPSLLPAPIEEVWRITTDFDFVANLLKPWFPITYDKSIAGCTAATLYGRQGLKVALVDRESSPDYYKKICNHFIQPFAVQTFKRLGIVETLEAAGAVRNGDIRVFTRWGLIHATEGGHS